MLKYKGVDEGCFVYQNITDSPYINPVLEQAGNCQCGVCALKEPLKRFFFFAHFSAVTVILKPLSAILKTKCALSVFSCPLNSITEPSKLSLIVSATSKSALITSNSPRSDKRSSTRCSQKMRNTFFDMLCTLRHH